MGCSTPFYKSLIEQNCEQQIDIFSFTCSFLHEKIKDHIQARPGLRQAGEMSKDGGGLNLSCDVEEEVLGDVDGEIGDEEVVKETSESEGLGHMVTGEGEISNVLLKLP